MSFVILKMVRPDTRVGCSDTNYKLEIMNISQFKHDTTKATLQIVEWMNEIYIYGETYSETVKHQFNLYSTS